MHIHLAALAATAHDGAWQARYNDGKWLFIGLAIVATFAVVARFGPRIARRRRAS